MNSNEFITTDETAKLLFVTPYTVREYIKAGKLKAARIGKRYLLKKDEVLNFLNELIGNSAQSGQ